MKELRKLMPRSSHTIPLATSLLSAGEAFEVSEDLEPIDLNFMVTGGRDGFLACIVDGPSMLPHIRQGDVVFVDTYAVPNNGDTIVSYVNGRINVKTFECGPRGLFLVPKNGAFQEQQVKPTDSFYVIGVVRSHLAFE